jgi:serine/threonine protein kinase
MAIKRLSKDTTAEHFFREYEILKSVREGCHTNIVQIIKAFSDLEDDEITYNFVFPLALGNLKQLFNDVIMDEILHKASNTLWYQFEGLASAVAFLHENGVAHNDIKPSNVLLYKDTDGERLLTKIADFGLAIGTEGQARFEFGTEEAKSAFKYDAPEIRSRRGKDVSDFIAEAPATFKDLWMGDIWKLAAVFTELLSHLVLGTNGVSQFRNYVTTTDGNFESDRFEDIPITYDDDVKVKDEVRMWLDKMGNLEARAKEVVPLLQDMFGEASTRPTAEDLTRRLREVQLP